LNIEESWIYPGDIKDALEVVKGWDPYFPHPEMGVTIVSSSIVSKILQHV
jgi:hypothetical protein